jgi:hypothetical protein
MSLFVRELYLLQRLQSAEARLLSTPRSLRETPRPGNAYVAEARRDRRPRTDIWYGPQRGALRVSAYIAGAAHTAHSTFVNSAVFALPYRHDRYRRQQ